MQKETKNVIWSARIQEQEKSGQSISGWCKQNGVAEAMFYYWRKRLSEAAATCQLIALPLQSGPQSAPGLEIETPQGYLIRLGSQAQIGWLGDVLAALR